MESVLGDMGEDKWSNLDWVEYTDCTERYITEKQRLKKLRINFNNQDPRLDKPARMSYKNTTKKAKTDIKDLRNCLSSEKANSEYRPVI